MKHKMKITVSQRAAGPGVFACRHVAVREKLLKIFLGSPVKLTVLVPGDSVDEVAISETGTEDSNETV